LSKTTFDDSPNKRRNTVQNGKEKSIGQFGKFASNQTADSSPANSPMAPSLNRSVSNNDVPDFKIDLTLEVH
jgi:hypothetical protein